MNEIEKIAYRNHTISVLFDMEPMNPRRDWDNLGTMLCFHPKYDLGDVESHDISASDFSSFDEMHQYLVSEKGAVVVLPLSLHDHGGLHMQIGIANGWDCGQVGFIYFTEKDLRSFFNVTEIDQEVISKARRCIEGEVETYDAYLSGEVYGFMVEPVEGYEGESCYDSCSGFYDKEEMIAEAKACIDSSIKQREFEFSH